MSQSPALPARYHAQPYPSRPRIFPLFTDAEIERLKALLIMLNRRLAKHEPDAMDLGRHTTLIKLSDPFRGLNVKISPPRRL